jgi:hypothetical protein
MPGAGEGYPRGCRLAREVIGLAYGRNRDDLGRGKSRQPVDDSYRVVVGDWSRIEDVEVEAALAAGLARLGTRLLDLDGERIETRLPDRD